MKMNVSDFFNAKSFAVIGASRDETKVGNTIFRNLLQNTKIKVFPVNPNAEEILGFKSYKTLEGIKQRIDCIIIAVKAELVPEILNQAGKKRVKCAVIISSGFSESGNLELENKIKQIADKNRILILGPNVLGFINPYSGVNTTFFQGMPAKGNIAFISQSGALGVGILDRSIKEQIGFSGFFSLGLCTQLDFSDFIEYFSRDNATKIIAIYIESLKEERGKRFIEVCKRCKKPIVALKAGKTKEGSKAALSHTAALASEQGIYEGVFKQAGIIEVENINQLFEVADILKKLNKIGRRACIITNAGGLGVLSTDYCSQNNLEIPELPEKIKQKLNKILPLAWSKNNPIDVLGDALAERYSKVLQILNKEKFFDFFIVLLTPQYMTQPLETAKLLLKLKKPVFACFYGGEKIDEAEQILRNKVPFFTEIDELAKVVGKIAR